MKLKITLSPELRARIVAAKNAISADVENYDSQLTTLEKRRENLGAEQRDLAGKIIAVEQKGSTASADELEALIRLQARARLVAAELGRVEDELAGLVKPQINVGGCMREIALFWMDQLRVVLSNELQSLCCEDNHVSETIQRIPAYFVLFGARDHWSYLQPLDSSPENRALVNRIFDRALRGEPMPFNKALSEA